MRSVLRGVSCFFVCFFSYSTVSADKDSGFTWSVETESNIKFVEIERESVLAYTYNGVISDGLSFSGRGEGETKFESEFGSVGLNFSVGYKPITFFLELEGDVYSGDPETEYNFYSEDSLSNNPENENDNGFDVESDRHAWAVGISYSVLKYLDLKIGYSEERYSFEDEITEFIYDGFSYRLTEHETSYDFKEFGPTIGVEYRLDLGVGSVRFTTNYRKSERKLSSTDTEFVGELQNRNYFAEKSDGAAFTYGVHWQGNIGESWSYIVGYERYMGRYKSKVDLDQFEFWDDFTFSEHSIKTNVDVDSFSAGIGYRF